MGSFNIQVDNANKVLKAKVEGTFSSEDGMKSVEAYQKSIANLTVPEYEIDIDCTELNVTAPDTLPIASVPTSIASATTWPGCPVDCG